MNKIQKLYILLLSILNGEEMCKTKTTPQITSDLPPKHQIWCWSIRSGKTSIGLFFMPCQFNLGSLRAFINFCEWNDCDFSSVNSIIANTSAFFYSLLGLVSRDVWEGESRAEITTGWSCVWNVNHFRDFLTFLRNDFARFTTRRGLWFLLKC